MRYIFLLLLTLMLSAEVVELEEIEIGATTSSDHKRAIYGDVVAKEGYMQKAPMQRSITGAKALEVAGSNGDPIKILQTYAGVVSTNNDNANEIYIHGSKPREVSYSLNHLPLGYFFHLGGMYSVLAPEITEQIDAYLGGFDVSYGSMGAVVDVSLKYPDSNKGRIHIGMYDADFAVSGKIDDSTSIFIGARRSYFDLIADQIIDTLDQDKDDKSKKTTFTLFPQFYDGQFLLRSVVGDHVFSLEAFMANDAMKIFDNMQRDKDPEAVGKIESKLESSTIGARWVYLGDSVTSTSLLYRVRTIQDFTLYDDFFIRADLSQYGLYHESVFEVGDHKPMVGFDVIYSQSPIKSHFYDIESADRDTPVTPRDTFDIDKEFIGTSYTLFAQDLYQFIPSTAIRYGLRAYKTSFQEFDSGVDPRVAVVHNIDSTFSISAAVGKYSQFPSTIAVIDGFGNPKIKTYESSNHYTLSLQKSFKNNSSLLVEPFFKTFKDLAINDKLNNFESVGEGEAYGFDITYRKVIDNFNIIIAYTYTSAKRSLDTEDTKQYKFQGDIPHTLQINTNYRFANNYRVSLLAKYSSGAPYTPIIGTQEYQYEGKTYKKPIYGEYYSSRYRDYYDLDIQIGKKFNYTNSSLELSLELMNLSALIHKNISSKEYDDEYEESGVVEQMGFLPALHATYRF